MNWFRINLNGKFDWIKSNGTFVRGSAFVRNEFIKRKSLLEFFNDIRSPEQFMSTVEKLNGFYAAVRQTDEIVMAAVDRVRSIPLFYGCVGNILFLSDNAEWVREQVGDDCRDNLEENEFLLTGYVTGQETLYPSVKQLQAGELLLAREYRGQIKLEVNRYYRYIHTTDLDASEHELLKLLDKVVVNSIKRLITWADGRTIILPLSGGYDSRLIAIMLKRLGYSDTIAFSYGRPGNKESQISKQVAENIGIKWKFVPYSNETWKEWYQSEERQAYFTYAHNHASLPHIQDWPAVWVLKRRIPNDAVFVPGHSGDFLAGSHIPENFFDVYKQDRALGKQLFVDEIFHKHFSLWNWEKRKDKLGPIFEQRIIKQVEEEDLNSPIGAISAFEKWDWQERQAKFIINSVRVYEFWGYDWWLPLWDNEMMDLWSKIPLEWRVGQKLYIDYVTRIYAKTTGLVYETAIKSSNRTLVNTLKKAVKCIPVYPLANAVYQPIKKRQEYHNHPLAWYGIVEKENYDRVVYRHQSINSFLVKEVLGISIMSYY
ncbi:MAG: hypothetical protein GX892_15915 [Thermoanaerobacteraceae bacterium]|nr:hypothetical protein [Thermoanaerobacteraceae bacterium]